MITFKHTPGPWRKEPCHNGLGHIWRITAPDAIHVAYVRQSENGLWNDAREIAAVRSHNGKDDPAICDGNARLIESALEMFEAMQAQNAFIEHLAGREPQQGMGCQNLLCPDGCDEGKNLLEAARDAYQCALAKLNDTPQEAT